MSENIIEIIRMFRTLEKEDMDVVLSALKEIKDKMDGEITVSSKSRNEFGMPFIVPPKE